MNVIRVDELEDVRLAAYRNVRDRDLVARQRMFLAEGRLVVRRLLQDSGLVARSVLVTPAALASLDEVLVRRSDLPVYVVAQEVMNGVAGIDIHRGCLALGERPAPGDWRALAHTGRRLVVVEHVGDADNVGSLFRNAAAFGVDAVLLGPSCADPLYRKAIRTSVGASLVVPFAVAEPWPQALGELSAAGWAVTGMTPSIGAPLLREVAAAIHGRQVAIVVGHEGEGLTAGALAACEYQVRIPMAARVDSLNVATAAAVAFYEFSR